MKKIKIVIVDDEIEYVNDLAKGLDMLGYEVFKAGSGSHAMEVIARVKPDIALCDYKLEDMDGTQVIEKTKTGNPETKYIMVTAYYDESFNETFRKAGASKVVYKPINFIELDKTIKEVLHK